MDADITACAAMAAMTRAVYGAMQAAADMTQKDISALPEKEDMTIWDIFVLMVRVATTQEAITATATRVGL